MRTLAKSVTAIAVLSAAASVHAATTKSHGPVSTAAIRPDGSEWTSHTGVRVATNLSTGFEAPFVPGTINGQQGWGTSTFAPPGGVAANADISTVNPQSGVQALRLTDQPQVGNGNFTGAFSPVSVQPAPDQANLSVGLSINNVTPGTLTGGADYDIITQSPAQAALTYRMRFSFTGDIEVLDFAAPGATGASSFVDTGANWTPDTYMNVGISFLPSAASTPGAGGNRTGSIVYSINGTPIYTADSLINGTKIDQVIFFSDNFQVAGESADFDNLRIAAVPEPTTLAAVAGLGLVGLRRRR